MEFLKVEPISRRKCIWGLARGLDRVDLTFFLFLLFPLRPRHESFSETAVDLQLSGWPPNDIEENSSYSTVRCLWPIYISSDCSK